MLEALGRLHPFLVHFPVALTLAALAAEILYAARRDAYFGTAALFMITAAAWTSLPAFAVGFAAAAGKSLEPAVAGAFAVHRIVGIATPMLAFVAAGMGHSTRRSGQVLEQVVYRVFLVLSAASAAASGFYGGWVAHGPW